MSSMQQLFRLPLRGSLRLSRVRVGPQPQLSQIHLLRNPRPTSVPTFSTYAALFNSKSPSNASAGPDSDPNNDPYRTPPVSLESLGIGKNMKILLLVVLSVLGTIETWFWCKAIWTWWKGGEKEKEIEPGR
ncbi:hypothetical protein MGYG_06329 [Nannizzia gypsea CBS 118893]|uniref:Uncharacterized protein n=1 Tax=Arthroderma gypseum (strain ATCC MYA-4604 / CBS 118893) TaxID=535722 RepID=E4UZ02_ARTGP|nr:hypothetical protein MGYG_06329 [Nannizzia gypsea CBS 118893]EFR03332.1 hypothetical protein MGYG_06329 [Nannizzia gypsea CBS 118893]